MHGQFTHLLRMHNKLEKGRNTTRMDSDFAVRRLIQTTPTLLYQRGFTMKNTQLLVCALLLAVAVPVASLFAQSRSIDIKRINPPTLYETSAYTQVTTVSAGMKLVMVAGQVGRELNAEGPNTEENSDACPHPDMRGQYIVTMENVGKALAAGGATWDDVVRIRKFTTDMEDYLAVSHDLPVYWSPDKPPSSTLIEVSGLADPCFLVEIDVTAVVEPD